ncbi:MAG: hypothetical protein IPH10_04540 [bacterium]|nr:hypothetical protein [bacterium]
MMQTRLPHLSAGIVVTIGAAVAIPDCPQAVFLLAIAALADSVSFGGNVASVPRSHRDFSKQIVPLLLLCILAAGLPLGQPGPLGRFRRDELANLGGNSLFANSVSSVIGAFMYFATLDRSADSARADERRYGRRPD